MCFCFRGYDVMSVHCVVSGPNWRLPGSVSSTPPGVRLPRTFARGVSRGERARPWPLWARIWEGVSWERRDESDVLDVDMRVDASSRRYAMMGRRPSSFPSPPMVYFKLRRGEFLGRSVDCLGNFHDSQAWGLGMGLRGSAPLTQV